MEEESPEVARHLAHNLRSLRETRGWTQQRLAKQSGVPRPTLATLESGSANPTLAVLVRVAQALGVSIEELIGPPRDIGRFYAAADLPRRSRSGVAIGKVLPDALPGLDIERLSLPPGGGMQGAPHTPGTREYLFCERGSLTLEASGSRWTLEAGDVVVFRGDQRHAYRCAGDEEAVGFSVVLLPPPGA